MYIDITTDLESRFKIAMAKRSPRLKIKTAIAEAIELWIEKQNTRENI